MDEQLFRFNLQLFSEEEKTEEATPKRKEEARKKGQVAKSSELNAAINLLALMILFFFAGEFIFQRFFMMVRDFYLDFLTMPLKEGQMTNLLLRFMGEYFLIMSPIFITAILAGLSANYFQVGFLTSTESLQFKGERLNPLEGFKRILSRKSAMELAKGIVKIGMVGYITYSYLSGEIETLLEMLFLGVEGVFASASSLFINLGFRVGILYIILAVLDYVYQRFEHQKSLRMSKYEVKEEHKQMEGDPHLKAKLKAKQREMSMNRMITEVSDSQVVVTNPTELAIALKYDQEKHEAPIVAAIGSGFMALKIKEIAREKKIPLVENKPVAQLLFRRSEIGEEIPLELYQAVAEILAVVMKLKKRGG